MSLTIIIGPMFAGKTLELIRRINLSKKEKLVINHLSDNRYNTTSITSHNGLEIPSLKFDKLESLFTNYHNNNIYNLESIDEIYIDESQFFTDLYETVWELVVNQKKNVIISGLDGDFEMRPFYKSKLLELIPLASEIIKLSSNCYICNKPAYYSKRLVSSNNQILIGTKDIYQPTCLEHHSTRNSIE